MKMKKYISCSLNVDQMPLMMTINILMIQWIYIWKKDTPNNTKAARKNDFFFYLSVPYITDSDKW